MYKNIKILIRKLLKYIAPWGLITSFQNFEKNKCFKEIKEKSKIEGYSSLIIANKIYESTKQVINGEARYERDGVLFSDDCWDLNIITSILFVMKSLNKNEINIVDFGGGMGTTYYKNKDILSKIITQNWNIVEQDAFIKFGRKIDNPKVKFYKSIDDFIALSGNQIDLIIVSNVIQYIDNSYSVIESLYDKSKFILFNKVPLSNHIEDKLFLQIINPKIYDAMYDITIYSKSSFLKYVNEKFILIMNGLNYDEVMIKKANIEFEYYWMLLKNEIRRDY